MRISISSPVRKSAFLGGAIAVGILSWALCWQAFAEHLVTRSASLSGYQTAVRIQPLNAFNRRVLGAALLQTNATEGAAMLEQSVSINSHDALAWMELSRAYGISGQYDKQHEAILRALAADPKDVGVEWDASVHLVQNRDVDGAIKLIRDVINNDPSKAVPGMQLVYGATGHDIPRTLEAVPPTVMARVTFMKWLVERGDTSGADQVWPSAASAGGNLLARDLAFYIDSLVARREVLRAESVWTSLKSSDPEVQRRTENGNLVVNGDFEDNLLNSGFDWRYIRTGGVTVTVDTSTFHSGTRSLALQFDADSLADGGLYQLVPVNPNTTYTLRGFMHSEELESANGPRMAVTDYYSGKTLMLGEEVLGSTSWRESAGQFTTDADSRLVKVSIVRSPANGRIRGKLWVDDLHMEPRP